LRNELKNDAYLLTKEIAAYIIAEIKNISFTNAEVRVDEVINNNLAFEKFVE